MRCASRHGRWKNNRAFGKHKGVTLYRIELVLAYIYEEAKKAGAAANAVSPTKEQLEGGSVETKQFNNFWEQYILETREWYLVAGLGQAIQFAQININYKTQESINEIFKIIIEKPAGLSTEKKNRNMLELIAELIFVTIMPRQANKEVLLQRT